MLLEEVLPHLRKGGVVHVTDAHNQPYYLKVFPANTKYTYLDDYGGRHEVKTSVTRHESVMPFPASSVWGKVGDNSPFYDNWFTLSDCYEIVEEEL